MIVFRVDIYVCYVYAWEKLCGYAGKRFGEKTEKFLGPFVLARVCKIFQNALTNIYTTQYKYNPPSHKNIDLGAAPPKCGR